MTATFRESAGEAPPAPRELSPDMRRDAAEHGRFLRLFGAIWAGVGGGLAVLFLLLSALVLPGLILGTLLGSSFALVGTLLWLIGRQQRAAAESVFRDGVETSGVVTEVFRDFRVRMNGRHPWRVAYELTGPDGRPLKGRATFWDDDPPHATVGQRLTVLHHRDKPSRSVLWTRLAGADGRLAQEAQGLSAAPGPAQAPPFARAESPAKAPSFARIESPVNAAPFARIESPANTPSFARVDAAEGELPEGDAGPTAQESAGEAEAGGGERRVHDFK